MKRIVTVGQNFGVVTAKFDPAEMIGRNFRYLDKKSLVFVERTVNLADAEYLSCLNPGEHPIAGGEKIIRLKKTHRIIHGPDLAMGLWKDYRKDPKNCVLERIWENIAITHIFFMADIIENEQKEQFIVYLCRSGDHHWRLLARLLDTVFTEHCYAVTSPVP